MASLKLARMPPQENFRMFPPTDQPVSEQSTTQSSGLWYNAPPATPQASTASIGSVWGSPLAVISPGPGAAPSAASASRKSSVNSSSLAALTADSEPVEPADSTGLDSSATSISSTISSSFTAAPSRSQASSRLSSRHNSQTDPSSLAGALAGSGVTGSSATPSGANVSASSNAVGPAPSGSNSGKPSEEIINTAIVVKNIPFAIKKEQLIEFMTQLGLPLPYAFNYHFDNGVFRGLAFANFATADETAVVISTLNGRELGGRKLRVEYKKMLPYQERERIEREKRERRGQLEEQHATPQHHHHQHHQHQHAGGAASSHGNASASGAAAAAGISGSAASMHSSTPSSSDGTATPPLVSPVVDLNNPETLQIYSSLLIFKRDMTKAELTLSAAVAATLPPTVPYVLNVLAKQLDLQFSSSDEHGIVVSKRDDAEALHKAEGDDAAFYLSGVFANAIASPMNRPASRLGSTPNLNTLSLNRWNSVTNLNGLGGMMHPSWGAPAAPPGVTSVGAPAVVGQPGTDARNLYEQQFAAGLHSRSSGLGRRM